VNLPQLAKLLDDVRLCDISYGDVVLRNLNATLSLATYSTPPCMFHIESTGNELLYTFDSLPHTTRNLVRRLVLLTPEELLVVEADLLCLRETRIRRHSRIDDRAFTISGYVVGVGLAIAVAVVLRYVFTVNAGGDVIDSLVWDGLLSVFRLYKGQ
jgi:hypothetical protein